MLSSRPISPVLSTFIQIKHLTRSSASHEPATAAAVRTVGKYYVLLPLLTTSADFTVAADGR